MASREPGHLPLRHFVLAGMVGIFACAPDQNPTGPANSADLNGTTSGGYHAVFLPTLGGISGLAADLNSADQIVGQSEGSDGFFHATLWENRVPRDLGALNGSSGYGAAYAISESGRIVGEAEASAGAIHAFLWTNGVMRDLGTLGGLNSSAQAINSGGVVVGYSDIPSADPTTSVRHAFKWRRGVMTDLGTLGGEISAALGINSFGHIVGYAENAYGAVRAVLWKDGKKIVLPHIERRGRHSQAHAINDDGQIVGFSGMNDGSFHAALWENGTVRDLGLLPGDFQSFAADINGAGLVAGYSYRLDGQTRAFLWNGQLRNLGPKAPISNVALGINKDGDIVGRSRHPTAEDSEFTGGCGEDTHPCRPTLWTRE